MVYVIILAIWFTINWVSNCITDMATRKTTASKFGAFVGTTLRYVTWAWLIYKIAQIY